MNAQPFEQPPRTPDREPTTLRSFVMMPYGKRPGAGQTDGERLEDERPEGERSEDQRPEPRRSEARGSEGERPQPDLPPELKSLMEQRQKALFQILFFALADAFHANHLNNEIRESTLPIAERADLQPFLADEILGNIRCRIDQSHFCLADITAIQADRAKA